VRDRPQRCKTPREQWLLTRCNSFSQRAQRFKGIKALKLRFLSSYGSSKANNQKAVHFEKGCRSLKMMKALKG
jgi:hypothetical protein